MKLRLSIVLVPVLIFLHSCTKDTSTEFLQEQWKLHSVTHESKCMKLPLEQTPREEAYILQFTNKNTFIMATSSNSAGGECTIISEGKIHIRNYKEHPEIGPKKEHPEKEPEKEYQKMFDKHILAAFDGVMTYTYSKNKLEFRGEHNQKIIFERKK